MHTVHTDGSASVSEMADAAAMTGMTQILFSEHVRHTSTYYPSFFEEVRSLEIDGLDVNVGIETKVLGLGGSLDCSPFIASLCDGIVGSVHNPPPRGEGESGGWSNLDAETALELEFQLAMAIVTKSRAHILGHPMGMAVTRFKLKPIEQINHLTRACRDFGKAFELNPRYCPDPDEWIHAVREAGCMVSVGSDAHRTEDVGRAWGLFVDRGRTARGRTTQ